MTTAWVAALLTVAAGACLSAQAGTITFSDGEFTSGWTDGVITEVNTASSSYSSANPASGGNPGRYRQETHTVVQMASPPSLAGFNWLALNSDANYNPSTEGTIVSIGFGFDTILESGNLAGYALALVQDGRFYRYFTGTPLAGNPAWTWYAFTGLTAGAFLEVVNAPTYGGVVVPGSNPDFSTAGSNIQFGYIVLNGFSGTVSATTGIDNWNVTVTNDVPEPGSLAMAFVGLLLIARKLRANVRDGDSSVSH
jgi:hypothetical protein